MMTKLSFTSVLVDGIRGVLARVPTSVRKDKGKQLMTLFETPAD